MDYRSTRDQHVFISASQAIIRGISQDGGLFVPCRFPCLRKSLEELKELNYQELAAKIMACYLPEFTEKQLKEYAHKAYDGFASREVVPVSQLKNSVFMLELWHGPTLAFKDMALQMLPQLLSGSLTIQQSDKKILILVATSGDTGKAALAGFADVPNTAISVFYPHDGVSAAQKLQMTTQAGENVQVTGIYGNFDDAQSAVKRLFTSADFQQKVEDCGYSLSSANSINWGRLLPQTVYYFWGYFSLCRRGQLKMGDKMNVCVPTGNFGNILAAYYAKQMGLPIDRLICASNENHVLTDFFTTGVYDIHRAFHKTNSPSMDILISSNLERLLYHLFDGGDEKIRELMAALKASGRYSVPDDVRQKMQEEFFVGYCDEENTLSTIRDVYQAESYLMDTHTAVGYHVTRQYQEKTGDKKPVLVASTACPYKFSRSVLTALGGKVSADEFANAAAIEEMTGWKTPQQILDLKALSVRFPDICEKEAMENRILEWIKG